ncbi:putative arsenate reductase protein [Phaeoacremonium minimum UCRPA7]|uniref:Putative arsenate reductase protein n=1 Tax=Phaeoacremonium minimum (strain UCR-PA7) TaxID=1286976 RepID=R8B9G8_PHAM7|nr:putative arsenate reductase protein [Phaeoacremonium minimum UCRPA7]EON95954.1 putative arsenate reductase protein [Phaeoacremonium minimum UCRPA7]
MRLLTGLAIAALSGLSVAASQEPAEVYILTADRDSFAQTSPPQIPRQVARDILFQRLRSESSYSDLPDSTDEETSLSHILKYGSSPAPLFEEQRPPRSQLVVILEGITSENAKSLRQQVSDSNFKQTFTISDPPSASANRQLVDVEFKAAGIAMPCEPSFAINPFDMTCWTTRSLVVKYDALKDSRYFSSFVEMIPELVKTVERGYLEATLVLMPESSRNSKLSYWTSTPPSQLQRRQSGESVLTEGDVAKPKTQASKAAGNDNGAFAWATADPKTIPACFQSFNSCATATGNCSGHGECTDKYAIPGQPTGADDAVCFRCECKSTYKYPEKGENSPHVHWGGNICQKVDVSSPFWLIAGLTIVLVGIVSFCIGLLFSVGEEKLPGVIGAGVSRSK